ncbi:Protein GAMETE EXPRESSED 3 [Capsicum baccatum]|uniref:Protein GAMETE EXPRESSED 3 n=1 Tax=Capsicum baccatum TaxID=33114 RepID=A0A2G2WXR0_CAPBA|nr:Protein GAMETE EXPRESSED 3 [Capsicum baccatum]
MRDQIIQPSHQFLRLFSLGQESFNEIANRLSKPLISDDGKVYVCSEKNFFAFESNGSVLWTFSLSYKCSPKDRVLKINPLNVGSSGIAVELFFGTESERPGEIIGLAISNNEGEIYALSTHSPHFKWIQDFSSFGSTLTMTTGNNGVLYVTVAAKALVLAVDVSRGIILWLKSFGPLSTEDYAPAVDSNGWISIGSLDGYLYSFSPKGVLKKFPKVLNMDSVIQVSPILDCSGYAIYVSQTQIEGKSTRIIGDYTYISGMKPEGVIFTLINPVTGTIFWSEKYPGQKFALSCSQITFKNFNAASLCMLPHEFLIYYMKYLHFTLCYVLESFILLLSTNCLVFDLGFSGAQLQSKDISAILHVGAPLGSRTSPRQFANARVRMTPTCQQQQQQTQCIPT